MLTSELVTAVRRQGSIPSTVTDATILAMGDEEIQGRFIPLLEVIRQNYFIREITATPDARGRIPVPGRAVGASLRNVQLYVNNSWQSLPLRAMEDADAIVSGSLPAAYYLDAGSICLLPNGSSGTVRIRYAARPGKMCLNTDGALCKIITAVTPGAVTTTIAAGGYVGSTLIDIISGGPAHQHKAILTTLTASTQVPTADLLEGLGTATSQGYVDYVTFPDMTPFVPLPEELFSALVHSVASNILLAKGYLEEASAQEKRAERLTSEARAFLMPRNEGNPQVVSGGLRRALMGGQSRRGRW